MITLTYGHKKPEDGDKGKSFFPALSDNIILDDGHSHNGINSPILPSSSIANTTQAITAGVWAPVAGKTGLYSQLVTLPGLLTLVGRGIFFKDTASGDMYNLSVEQVSTTTYNVFINDNTKNITAIYV